MPESCEHALVRPRKRVTTVSPCRHHYSPSAAGYPSQLLSGQRRAWEEMEAIRGVSRGECVIAERQLRRVCLDVHRPRVEATASAPQHLPAEIHRDDERPSRLILDGFAGDETSPDGYIEERAGCKHVGKQTSLHRNGRAPDRATGEPDIQVIERRYPPPLVGGGASAIGHRPWSLPEPSATPRCWGSGHARRRWRMVAAASTGHSMAGRTAAHSRPRTRQSLSLRARSQHRSAAHVEAAHRSTAPPSPAHLSTRGRRAFARALDPAASMSGGSGGMVR